jgi:hypothetical protein
MKLSGKFHAQAALTSAYTNLVYDWVSLTAVLNAVHFKEFNSVHLLRKEPG